jgi:L-rhamnose isomerase
VEITSRLRGVELVGSISAGDRMVEVAIVQDGRERVRRSYLAPRLTDVDLLGRAVEEGAADPIAVHALTTASRLLGVDSEAHTVGSHKRGGQAQEPGQ